MLSSEQLYSALEYLDSSEQDCVAVKLILAAISDWPSENLEEPEELLKEIKKETKNDLGKEGLQKLHDSMSPAKDSWKSESLSSLLELMAMYPQYDTLDKIFIAFDKKYAR